MKKKIFERSELIVVPINSSGPQVENMQRREGRKGGQGLQPCQDEQGIRIRMGMTKRLRVIPSMIDEMREVIIVIAVGVNEDISHRLTFMFPLRFKFMFITIFYILRT